MRYETDDDRESELADLRRELRTRRSHERRLLQHPDPQDPDHPGDYPGAEDDQADEDTAED